MPDQLRYDPAAARRQISAAAWQAVAAPLDAARHEVWDDLAMLRSGSPIPTERQPLDAGFIDLPARLLAEYDERKSQSLVGRIETAAQAFREAVDGMVLLGIGGSYMGLRALFEALRHPYHNELSRPERNGLPRLYCEGNNVDSDAVTGLLEVLRSRYTDRREPAGRWGIVVISKSGGTLETAAAFRVFRDALERYYGADAEESRRLVIPITGQTGRLRELCAQRGYPAENVFPIPDDVGGRYSIFTAVGLVPAAVLGIDLRALLRGAADMTERCRTAPLGDNPVLDYTAVCHLLERDAGLDTRVLSTWGKRLEAAGLWYDQLLSESLGKQERGATPITVVNTRDLHSRGQQHQEGKRDKLITNVIVEQSSLPPVKIPSAPANLDQDQLNKLSNRTYADVLRAAIAGTNQAYAEAGRPTADIVLPRLDEYALGQLFQMLMLATVVEGRLIGVNPYGQPGVEAYKRNMTAILGKS